MSIGALDNVRGLPALLVSEKSAQPLKVTLALAEKTRSIALAKVERAGFLPGLSASAAVGNNRSAGLRVNSDKPLGFGTGASLEAIKSASEAAGRRVAQANEDSNRALRKLESEIAATSRQATEASAITAQAKGNLDLFQAQYDAGQRQVMDVVGVYEIYARQQVSEVGLKHDAARLRIEMARLLGVLADGDTI